MSLLSDLAIEAHLRLGTIVIDPFKPERLNTDSYDLELGPYFWRYALMRERQPAKMIRGQGFDLVDARTDGGLWLSPGERVLGHSVEVAGGRVAEGRAVTTSLHATSTAARHGISACLCAGFGDVSFINYWVFEISNHTRDSMWLPVGAIIAQIAFTEVEVPSAVYGEKTGNYVLDTLDPDEIRKRWRPRDMLPKPLKVRDGWKAVTWVTDDDKGTLP